jgi:hypothetical protein
MSASPPTAAEYQTSLNRSFGPFRDSCSAAVLFDQPIRSGEHGIWNSDTQHSSFEIQHKLALNKARDRDLLTHG